MSPAEDGLVHDWDRADPHEWATTDVGMRWSRLAIAFALVVVGALVGIFGSVPGAVNGATFLAVGMIVGAIVITLKEIYRG